MSGPHRYLTVKAADGAVHLDEHFLCEILSVSGGTGEAVAKAIYTPMEALHDFFPSSSITVGTAVYQLRNDLCLVHPRLHWSACRSRKEGEHRRNRTGSHADLIRNYCAQSSLAPAKPRILISPTHSLVMLSIFPGTVQDSLRSGES